MESKKSLAELTNNQQIWTEEDIEDVKKITESISELKRVFELYSIKKRNISNDKIYLKYYKEYTIISSIFETFIYNDFISLKNRQ